MPLKSMTMPYTMQQKLLEVAIRTKARLSDDIVGAALVNRAFKPDKPILRYSNIEAEQEGMMSLLRGMI